MNQNLPPSILTSVGEPKPVKNIYGAGARAVFRASKKSREPVKKRGQLFSNSPTMVLTFSLSSPDLLKGKKEKGQ